MRLLFVCLLAVGFVLTDACAEQPPAFAKRLSAHLQSHKINYPRDLGLDHPVELLLQFSIERDGKLLNPRIQKGSGSAKLDEYALQWLIALDPLPAIPVEEEAPKTMTLPLRFMVRSQILPALIEEDERKIKRMIGAICKGC